MHRDAGFWNWIAERYARRPIDDQAAYDRKLEITRRFLHPRAEVLEFGCGTGSTALLQAPHAQRILAIDISPRMLEIARSKASAQGIANVEFREAGIDEFEAPDDRFDMVMGHSILHLLRDRDAAIAKVFRMLKPGGTFVSSTMCLADGFGFMRPILPVGRALGLLPLVRVFSADDLRRRIERAGFEILEDWRPGPRKAAFMVARKP